MSNKITCKNCDNNLYTDYYTETGKPVLYCIILDMMEVKDPDRAVNCEFYEYNHEDEWSDNN